MRAGERLRAGIHFPPLRAGFAIERVNPAAEIAKINRVIGDECRRHNRLLGRAKLQLLRHVAISRGLFRGDRRVVRIAIRPHDLAVRRELIEPRFRRGAEVGAAVHDGRRRVDDADHFAGTLRRETPFFDEPRHVLGVERRLRRIEAPASHVVVVHRPIGRVGLGQGDPRRRRRDPQKEADTNQAGGCHRCRLGGAGRRIEKTFASPVRILSTPGGGKLAMTSR